MNYDIDDGEFDITPFELAIMFAFRGWSYDIGEVGLVPPTEIEIRDMFGRIVNQVMEDGRPSASERMGRFLAVRHDETGNSVDLYLNIGYVWAFESDEEESIDD